MPSPVLRGSGAGVTTRLIALVMLPVTVMCLLSGSVVLSRRSSASHAVRVENGVAELSDLASLRAALHVLETIEAFEVRFEGLGVTQDLASTYIGVDVGAEETRELEEATRAVALLGSASPVSTGVLESLYAEIDGGTIDSEVATQRLHEFLDVTAVAMMAALEQLEAEVTHVPLVAAMESLPAVSALVDAAAPQAIDLSVVWFPTPGDAPQASATALARLAAGNADYAAATESVRDVGVPTVLAGLARIESDADVQVFRQAVSAALLGQPLADADGVIDYTKVAATFQGYFARDALLDGLTGTVTTAIRDEARQLAASERAAYMTWMLGAAALAFVSVGIALWLARSISKPLKDLASYAHAVNEGELDAELLSKRNRGPKETRMAFGVFADLVANLQLLDAKANALAHCDFDDPVLLVPLPGRLGRSLESSVALLSGSIVERDQLQTHLAHEATHDSLTGISNRPAAITAIDAAMHRATRTGATIAVLFVDLNEFKSVNDSHGHEVGDEVLRVIAGRMSADLRSGDFVARLGGDEFVVVAEGIADAADATDVARRIIDIIGQPIDVDGLRIVIGAAVGIAMTLDGPEEPLRLLARADAAMYRAKYHKQSAIEIFDADLQQQMIEREDVETALTAALIDPTGGGLQLHYQPVLDATSGVVVGAEALIRWERAGHGMQLPDSFIPIAEATALIIDVDCWVLNAASQQLVAWSCVDELARVPIAVNISGRHLLSRLLPEHIKTVLERSGLDPRRLTIEITETVLLTDLAVAATELDAVRALGVRVAIDDFGTGYTSLAHLQQLPIDTIKIDRSFISQLNVRRGSSLVRMVTDLGHAIDINIVAEGVETDEELSALQAMGADHLQGYLLSRPLPPDALATWAQRHIPAACYATAEATS